MKPYPIQLTILVDQDGVITGWTPQFNADLAEYYPDLTFEELREFTTPTHLPQTHQDAINFVKNRAGFYRAMPLIEGAREALEEMRAAGHDVWICTSPETNNPTCASDKIEWVREHLGEGWVNRVIITRDKTLVRGHFLFDDRPEVKGADQPTWEHILVDQPYNDDVTDKRRVSSLAAWRTIIEGAA